MVLHLVMAAWLGSLSTMLIDSKVLPRVPKNAGWRCHARMWRPPLLKKRAHSQSMTMRRKPADHPEHKKATSPKQSSPTAKKVTPGYHDVPHE